MEITKLEAKDIQTGQPRILSTVGSIKPSKPYNSSVIAFETISPADIVPGKPRIFKTIPGVEGHENMQRPAFAMRYALKNWDHFNIELYRSICEAKEINGTI